MYVYEAIKRTKENSNIEGPRIIREVLYAHQTEEQVITKLKKAITEFPGVWRIYRTVNKRNYDKARLELAHTLFDQLINPEGTSNKNPESLWKDILLQPRNKSERLFLLDIDTKDNSVLLKLLTNPQLIVRYKVETPNGYHLICEPFNPELIQNIEQVEVKKDALVYIETVEIV